MKRASAVDAIRAAKMLIMSIQWSKDGGTDQTGWGVCPECGADDFRGHEEGCTVVVVLNQLDEAINNFDKGPAT